MAREAIRKFANPNDTACHVEVIGSKNVLDYKKVKELKLDVKSFPADKVKAYKANKKALDLVVKVVDRMYDKSAMSLTQWSHVENSPWYNTVYQKDRDGNIIKQRPWNTRIEDSLIKDYFSKPENRIFG